MVIDKLRQCWPPADWCETTVVAAVSGGADSVALLRGLHQIKSTAGGRGQLVAAHFNHRLRGDESDADQAFVVTLCSQLHVRYATNFCEPDSPDGRAQPSMGPIPLPPAVLPDSRGDRTAGAFPETRGGGAQRRPAGGEADDELETLTGGSSEDESRRARYAFLRQVVLQVGARYLVTAHTADDQAETVLHRILRGTGLEGLEGIPRVRAWLPGVALVRPLLAASRLEVLAFLDELRQPYRVDSSNESPRYTRNRLRLDLVPRLEREYNPRVRAALCRLAELASESNGVVRQQVMELEERAVVRRTSQAVVLDCRQCAAALPYLVRSLLLSVWRQQGWPLGGMSREKWEQVAGLAMAPPGVAGPVDLPGHLRADRVGDELTVRQEAHGEIIE